VLDPNNNNASKKLELIRGRFQNWIIVEND
jgi:hypothetical protein